MMVMSKLMSSISESAQLPLIVQEQDIASLILELTVQLSF